jgi:hypothetical protein
MSEMSDFDTLVLVGSIAISGFLLVATRPDIWPDFVAWCKSRIGF